MRINPFCIGYYYSKELIVVDWVSKYLSQIKLQKLLNKQLHICGHSTNDTNKLSTFNFLLKSQCKLSWATENTERCWLTSGGGALALSLDAAVFFFVFAILFSPENSSIYRVGEGQTSTDFSYLIDLGRKYTFGESWRNALNYFFFLLESRNFILFSVRVAVNRNVKTALLNIKNQ